MNQSILRSLAVTTVALPLLAGCADWKLTRVQPGESVEIALAKKATAMPTPTPPPSFQGGDLPDKITEAVLESVALGNFCLEAGKNEEAAAAFEKAARLDPTFAEAWKKLAVVYQNTGRKEKAEEALRKFKTLTERE